MTGVNCLNGLSRRSGDGLQFILALIILSGSFIDAQEQVFNGARPLGMGGAYVAVADDGNTLNWNPAGMPGLRRHEILTSYSNLFGLNIINGQLGYIFPVQDKFAVGAGWNYLGFNDGELGYSSHKFNFSAGIQPLKFLAVGAAVKYIANDLSLDGTSHGNSRGLGLDLGLLFTPGQTLRFGLVAYDLTGTSVTYDNNSAETVLHQKISAGAAWSPVEGLTVAADLDDRWHVGAEYWLSSTLGIRGGLERNRDLTVDEVPLIPALGFSIRYKSLKIDYGFESNPYLFPTHRISIGFQFQPALVSIESAGIIPIPIFRSLHRHYEDQDFAEVTLKNSAEKNLPVTVSLYVPTVMETPHSEQLLLPPGSSDLYPLGVTFAEDILSSPQAAFDHLVQPELNVRYSQEQQEKFATFKLAPTYILGRGKINWDDPKRIASFVTPEAAPVDQFTRSVLLHYSPILMEFLNKSNLGKAMILFDALGDYGITYSPDLNTPFLQISKDRTAFDTVKYPQDLLRSKVGDCDDLTVLFGSMLENLGIATVFLDVFAPGEGHIFLMFDSGISPADVPDLFLNPQEVVEFEGKIWIPVETTMIGHPFFTAWQQGIFEYVRRDRENTINRIDIRMAQNIYRPGNLEPGVEITTNLSDLNSLLKTDLNHYDKWVEQIVRQWLNNPANPEDNYNAGVVYLRFNRLEEARSLFRQALKYNPRFPDALNSIGVTYTRQGDFSEALKNYEQALALSPGHSGFRLNVAITHFLAGQKNEAREEYRQVVADDPRLAGSLDLLFGIQDSTRAKIRVKSAPVVDLPKTGLTESLKEKYFPERKSTAIPASPSTPDRKTTTRKNRQAYSNNSIGLVFAKKENYEMAVMFFEKAHTADPGVADYLANLALAHYRMRAYGKAVAEYKQLIKTNPEYIRELEFIESRGKENPPGARF